jgi:DNA-directed RNA polymerase subunit RPC12/RpoP
MANYYCEYCGSRYPDIANLTGNACPKHPNGQGKGKHSLYQGSEKSQYNCRYCGLKASSIQNLTTNACPKHPNGMGKGRHAPAL